MNILLFHCWTYRWISLHFHAIWSFELELLSELIAELLCRSTPWAGTIVLLIAFFRSLPSVLGRNKCIAELLNFRSTSIWQFWTGTDVNGIAELLCRSTPWAGTIAFFRSLPQVLGGNKCEYIAELLNCFAVPRHGREHHINVLLDSYSCSMPSASGGNVSLNCFAVPHFSFVLEWEFEHIKINGCSGHWVQRLVCAMPQNCVAVLRTMGG